MSRAARGRLTAPVLTLVLLLLAGLAAASPAPAADGNPSGTDLQVHRMTPRVLTAARGELELSGTVVNTSARALDGLRVGLRARGTPIAYRSQLSQVGTDQLGDSPVAGGAQLERLAPGASAAWRIKVKLEDLGLERTDSPQVYGLVAEVRSGGGQRLDHSALLLPLNPAKGADPGKLRITTLWPLVDRSHRDGTTLGDDAQTPVFTDDELARSFAPGGRLSELVRLGREAGGVTWVVDPDLLDSADEMRTGYHVAAPGTEGVKADAEAAGEAMARAGQDPAQAAPGTPETTSAPGPGGQAAATWLDGLRAATAGTVVGSLPYGDTDLAAVAHHPELRPELSAAITRGAATTGRVLGPGREIRGDLAWPVEGAVDKEIVATATETGSALVVASGTSLPLARPDRVTWTPSALFPLAEKTSALVTDPRVDALLAKDVSAPGEQVPAAQALAAELLMIPREEPSRARSLLIAPDRRMSAATAQVLRDALEQVRGWSKPASLTELAGGTYDPDKEARTTRAYPKQLRAGEPSTAYLQSVAGLQTRLGSFAGILTRPERVVEPFEPALLRCLSTAWRGDQRAADTYRLTVARSLGDLEDLVYAVRKRGVTLSGESGHIPVTVVNNLQQPITVVVQVVSRQPNRLSLGEPETVTIPSGHRPSIKFPASSKANGKVEVEVRLLTPDGRQFGPAQDFYVETTSIDGITLGIIGTIAALLALFSVRAYLRRRRGTPAPDPDAPLVPEHPGTAGGISGDVSGAPAGAPAAGTTHENTPGHPRPAGPNERVDR